MIQKKRGRRKKRVCASCADKVTVIDYKDISKLRRYVSERGKTVSYTHLDVYKRQLLCS